MDYKFGIKHPYRWHRHILKNVLIMQSVQVTLYTMGNSSPYVGDPTLTVERHTTTAFACTHTLWDEALSLRSVN